MNKPQTKAAKFLRQFGLDVVSAKAASVDNAELTVTLDSYKVFRTALAEFVTQWGDFRLDATGAPLIKARRTCITVWAGAKGRRKLGWLTFVTNPASSHVSVYLDNEF